MQLLDLRQRARTNRLQNSNSWTFASAPEQQERDPKGRDNASVAHVQRRLRAACVVSGKIRTQELDARSRPANVEPRHIPGA